MKKKNLLTKNFTTVIQLYVDKMHLYLLGLYITASRTEQHQKNIDVTKFKFFNYQIIEVLGGEDIRY